MQDPYVAEVKQLCKRDGRFTTHGQNREMTLEEGNLIDKDREMSHKMLPKKTCIGYCHACALRIDGDDRHA